METDLPCKVLWFHKMLPSKGFSVFKMTVLYFFQPLFSTSVENTLKRKALGTVEQNGEFVNNQNYTNPRSSSRESELSSTANFSSTLEGKGHPINTITRDSSVALDYDILTLPTKPSPEFPAIITSKALATAAQHGVLKNSINDVFLSRPSGETALHLAANFPLL